MRIHTFAVPWLFVIACATNTPTGEAPLSPAPPEGGQQLASSTYDLQPGEELYMCYQFYSPKDAVAITKVESISMPGVHHMGIYQAFGRNEEDAPHECMTLIKDTWLPVWGSGTGSPELTLPDGTGFVIQPQTQYILQLHLQNTTDGVLKIRGGVNLTYNHDVTNVTPAGMYAFGTFRMTIPPTTTDYQVPIDCQPGKLMNVFAVFPHMHKIGTKLEVTRAIPGSDPAPFYKIDPWVFGNQPMDPLFATSNPGDQFHLVCHYNNPTANAVTYGESSDNEMCFFVLFYYPFDHLDGCVAGS
jgi:hypothetical protein